MMIAQCDPILLQAKRVILQEQIDKIAAATLSSYDYLVCSNGSFQNNTNQHRKNSDSDAPSDKENHTANNKVLSSQNNAVDVCNILKQKKNVIMLRVKDKMVKKYFDHWKMFVKQEKEQVEDMKKLQEQREKLEQFFRLLKKRKKEQLEQKSQGPQSVTTKTKDKSSFDETNSDKSFRDETKDKIISNSRKSTKLKRNESAEIFKDPVRIPSRNVKTAEGENFKNRYEAQKNIIEMQKAKLEEQERMIQALKLGKIKEELQKSMDDAKNNIKNIFQGASSKVKCKVTPILSVGVEETHLELELHSNKAPKIIQEMEKRAEERASRRQMILERKRLLDEQRKRIQEEQIERKKAQDEEEKKRNLEAMKERRKKELEIEKRKQLLRQQYEQQLRFVYSHYNRKLKNRYLHLWIQDIIERHLLEIKCEEIYKQKIVGICFSALLQNLRKIEEGKYAKADKLYQTKLLQRVLQDWKKDTYECKQAIQVAMDLYDMRLECRIFKHWHRYVCIQYMVDFKNSQKADKHYKRRILFHYFYQWKSLPVVLRLERAKEEKRQKWRQKVWEVVPDYRPPQDDFY